MRPQVAALIHSLQLERNGATLLLSNLLDEEDGDDDALTRPATKVRLPAPSMGVYTDSLAAAGKVADSLPCKLLADIFVCSFSHRSYVGKPSVQHVT